jgi:hypothetical protein
MSDEYSTGEVDLTDLNYLKALAEDKSKWFELGQELYKLQDASRGTGAFTTICESLGLAGRTGYHIARVAKKLDQLMLEPPAGLGWRKLADAIDVMDFSNYLEIFDKCEKMSREELASYLLSTIKERIAE